MKTGFSIVLFVVFMLLSVLHFYWALKGTWGLKESLPTTVEGKPVLSPSTLNCSVVGIFLMLFSGCYLQESGCLDLNLPFLAVAILKWIIPFVFLLRAIGEFRYVGFFKQVVGTQFSQLDSWMYSPLCLVIALLGFVIIRLE